MQPARFRPHERITDPAVFRLAFERKRSVSDAFLIIYGVENGLDHCRMGISASKRRIRKASDRNRVKRVLREAFRISKSELPSGVDLIIVPRGKTLSFAQARDSLPNLARSVVKAPRYQAREGHPVIRSVGRLLEGLATAILFAAIRVYQLTISPLLGPACRFEPTCSRYLIEAVRKYGLIPGLWKGLRRLSRCHPWHPGGFDPP